MTGANEPRKTEPAFRICVTTASGSSVLIKRCSGAYMFEKLTASSIVCTTIAWPFCRDVAAISIRGSRSIHWMEFRRNRKEGRVRSGYGFRLEFKEPVPEPLALGYGCHFGLGQFREPPK